jgi:hypothetical protein
MKLRFNMKNNKTISNFVLFALFLVLSKEAGSSEQIWSKVSSNFGDNFSKLFVCQNSGVYLSAKNTLYASYDLKTLANLKTLPLGVSINDIAFSDCANETSILAATDKGAFEGHGYTWKNIYSTSESDKNNSLSIYPYKDGLLIGTQNGLFVKKNGAFNWQNIWGLQNKSVYSLKGNNYFIYASTRNELFVVTLNDLTTKKIFSDGLFSKEDEGLQLNPDIVDADVRFIKAIAVDPADANHLIVATSNSIVETLNQGKTWSTLIQAGLPYESITSLLILKANGGLIIGSGKGAFLYFEDKISPLYQGLEDNNVIDLAFYKGRILALTSKGFYQLDTIPQHQLANTLRIELVENEPTIQEVHKMAIEYAEVNPEKIKNWRRLAQKRAWYPRLSLGLDSGHSRTVSDSVYGSSSGGGQHYVGPDDKSTTNDMDWDASFSWDLANIVWDDVQTSIDSRAKLMVELREDVLDQVTRLYFERRRVQQDLLNNSGVDDASMRFEKQMRLEELTALIDALTGGNFSLVIQEGKIM